MKNRFLSVAILILVVLGLILSPLPPFQQANANTYTPLFPKTPPTTSIIVLDMSHENANNWRDFEAQVASLVIQGIVNRTSSEKIYFTNVSYPWRWQGEIDHFALANNLVPVPKTYPTIDTSKEFPVLSYLMQHYGSYIQGKIKYPALTGNQNGGLSGNYNGTANGAFTAALTAAGQTDAIPLSPHLETYLANEGYALSTVADTTGLTDSITAHRWARDNYFTANTTRKFIAKFNLNAWNHYPADFVYADIDYWISSRAFVMNLDGNYPDQYDEILDFLVPSRYPYATPIIGDSSGEGEEIEAANNAGYPFMFGPSTANFSVFSSFPSDPSLLTAPPAPASYPVANNDAYVAFYFSEGDNLKADIGYHLESYAQSIVNGQVPIAYTANPVFLDIFPTLLQYRSNNTQNGAIELMADYNDGMSPTVAAAQAPYISNLKHYLDNTNGLFQSLSILGRASGGQQEYDIIDAVDPLLTKLGYTGAYNGNTVTFQMRNNNFSVVTTPSGATGNIDAAEIEQAVRAVVDNTPPGQPAFVLVCAGDGVGRHALVKARDAMFNLQQNPLGRNYRFVKPSEMATQYKVWQGHLSPALSAPPAKVFPAQPAAGAALDRSMWYVKYSKQVNPYIAYNTVDGDMDTLTIGVNNQQAGDYFLVDMGTSYTYDTITLQNQQWDLGASPRSFDVYVSNDGSNWGNPVTSGTTTGTTLTTIQTGKQTSRFLKIQLNADAGVDWRIAEINILAADPSSSGTTYTLSADFASIQGADGWYYKEWNGSSYSDLSWDAGNNRWQGSYGLNLIWSPATLHPDTNDTVIAWKAPQSGTVSVTGTASRAALGGDGANVKIMKNGTQIWPASGWQHLGAGGTATHNLSVSVSANDHLYFVVNQIGNYADDTIQWDPTIQYGTTPPAGSYTLSSDFSSIQGSDGWYYKEWNGSSYSDLSWDTGNNRWQGSYGLNLIWSPAMLHPDTNDTVIAWKAPQSGTVSVTGTATRAALGGDGANVKILKNGTQVWPASGWQHLGAGGTATHNLSVSVSANDHLYFVVNQIGNYADDTIQWDPTISY